MIQTRGRVIDKVTLAPAWWQVTLSVPELAADPNLGPRPGQFFLARTVESWAPCYLRRPIFPAGLHETGFSFFLHPDPDPGLSRLLACAPDEVVDLIGPLGAGFTLPAHVRNLLLVSEGQTMGPLLLLLHRAVEAGLAVTLALGGRRAANIYPLATLPSAVEVQVATLDGSLGHRGAVTALTADLLGWADLSCAIGSTALYRELRRQAQAVRLRATHGFLYGLIANLPLACGVGACLGCAIETETGWQLACLDGPLVDLSRVAMDNGKLKIDN